MTEQTDHPPIPRVQVARYLAHELAMAFDELPEEYLSDEAAESAIAALQLMLDSLRALDRFGRARDRHAAEAGTTADAHHVHSSPDTAPHQGRVLAGLKR